MNNEIIEPWEFWNKIAQCPEFEAVFSFLGNNTHLLKDNSDFASEELLFKHSVNTANRLSYFLINLKSYQYGKNIKKALPFILAALLHDVEDIGIIDEIPLINTNKALRSKIIKSIKNYRNNLHNIDKALYKGSSDEAIRLFMENHISSPEELLFYFADLMDTIHTIPKNYIVDKDAVYLKVLTSIAEIYGFEELSSTVYSYLFRVKNNKLHKQMENIIKEKHGEYGLKLENQVTYQLDELNYWLEDTGFMLDDFVIFGRVKSARSIYKKVSVLFNYSFEGIVGEKDSARIYNFLKENGYIDTNREVTDKYYSDRGNLVNWLSSNFDGFEKDSIIQVLRESTKAQGRRLQDIRAFRVIFEQEKDFIDFVNKCLIGISKGDKKENIYIRAYLIEGSNMQKSLQNKVDDIRYKKNLYQSIHLTIKEELSLSLSNGKEITLRPGEYQFRTREMHEHAEIGEGSHIGYKGGLDPFTGNKLSLEEKFDIRREEVAGKMVVDVNGTLHKIDYTDKEVISYRNLAFQYLLKDDSYYPVLEKINGKRILSQGQHKIIRAGDKIDISLKEVTLSNFFNSNVTLDTVPDFIDLLKRSPLMDRPEYYQNKVDEGKKVLKRWNRQIKGKKKIYKNDFRTIIENLYLKDSDNKKIKSSQFLLEDFYFALGTGLLTEKEFLPVMRDYIKNQKK